MTEFFKKCGNTPAIAVIFDFPTDTEIFFIGSGESIRQYAYDSLPEIVPKNIMRHKCKIGNITKNINRLMGTKYEIDDIVKISEKLCDVSAFCDGSCASALDELADLYETSDYCNVLKNFVIYEIYCAFAAQKSAFNKKVGITVKGNHDRAGKFISAFKKEVDRIITPLLSARKERKFVIGLDLFSRENFSVCTIYKVRSEGRTVTVNTAENSYIAFLDMYADLLSAAGKFIYNCEICDNLSVADRTNYAPVCNRTTCKRTHQTKINTSSRKTAQKFSPNHEYTKWDGKCANYRKKLLGLPEQLAEYDTLWNEFREKLKNAKKGLTKKSRAEDLEIYQRLCFDAALELQEVAITLKNEGDSREK